MSCLVWIDRLKLFWLSFIFQLNFWTLFNVYSFIHWSYLRNGFRLNVDHRWNDANNRRKPLERQRDKEGGSFFFLSFYFKPQFSILDTCIVVWHYVSPISPFKTNYVFVTWYGVTMVFWRNNTRQRTQKRKTMDESNKKVGEKIELNGSVEKQ